MSRHLVRLFKSISRLGVLDGCRVFYAYVFHRVVRSRKWSCRPLRLRNVSQPVWFRPGVSDWIVMERIFLDREYDPLSAVHDQAMDRLEARLTAAGRKPLILDCGANVGLSSVWLTERFPRATVIALEPQAANFEVLSRNARNYPNILPMHAAISDRMSRVALVNPGEAPWTWRTTETDAGGVAAVTIPHLLGLDSRYSLMLVKVDIEGFEVNLFRDGAAWVDSLPLLVFEMHDWMLPGAGSGHAFLSILSRRPRDYLLHGENVFAYGNDLLTP